ncbi:MAG: ABC transporter permease [Firmicutes bacterium]|nr:ABC transporter permease [Bacillota bacterium]
MKIILEIGKGILEQGFIYGIMALGVYISYQVLNFPDLAVDGTFPLGAAITAVLTLKQVNPYLACLLSFFAGALAGFITGLLHVKLGIKDLLAGILTMTALWSVNLTIAKTSLLSTYGSRTIFTSGPILLLPRVLAPWRTLILSFLLALFMKFLLDWYLTTRSGLLLRAVGDNPQLATSLAKDPGQGKILGLTISNGFVALAGAVLCQQQKFFDVNMGTGIIVMGLASVIIGLTIGKNLPVGKHTTMVLLGSILYKAALSMAINLGFHPNYLKLIMAILFTGALVGNDVLGRKEGGGKGYEPATIKKY